MKINWFKYSAPSTFYPLAHKLVPVFAGLAFLLIMGGLYWGFFQTPDLLTDQKQYYRILYVHVGAAWMSMWLYAVLVFWALIGLIFNTRLAYMLAAATAPTGAIFTFLTLWTGAFWGKTSWGTYWDWDPRMTTELILLFLYIGYMALQSAIDDSRRSDRASALLATVGLVLIPIIFWSVNCPDPNQCAALHQQSSMSQVEGNIRIAWLVTALGFWMFAFMVILMRVKNIILQREQHTTWVKRLIRSNEDQQ